MTIVASGEMDLRLSPAAQSRLENDLNSALKRGSTAAGKPAGEAFGKSFGGALTGVAAFSAIRAGFRFLADSVGEFTEKNAGIAKTGAILKATGGAANVSADEIEKLSSKLGKLAAVDDDVVRESANVLLTFKNIKNQVGEGNDVFDQAALAVQNLSQVFGGIEASSLQVGKALNDPIKGIAALGRAGVTFTAEQKELIKTLQESGDILGAQKIILAEIEGQVGGTAEAFGDSLAGKVQRAGVAFDDLKESLGAGLAPILEKTAPLVSTLALGIGELPPAIIGVGVGFSALIAGAAVFIRIKSLIQGTTASLAEMGTVGRLASSGLGALGKVSLIGAGVATLAIAVRQLGEQIDKVANTQPKMSALTDSLVALADGSGDVSAVTDVMVGSLSRFTAEFERADTPAARGEFLRGYKDSLDDLDKSLTAIVQGGAPQAANDALIELAANFDIPIENLLPLLDDYNAAIATTGTSNKVAAAAAGEAKDGIGGIGDAAADAAPEVKNLDDQIRILGATIDESALGQFTSMEEAQIRYRDALAKMGEQLTESGTSFDIATDAGRRNKDQLLTVIDTAERYVEGLVRTGRVAQTNEAFNAAFVGQLRAIGDQFPALRGQIDLYIAKLGQAPTELTLDADATPALNAIDKVNNIVLPDKTVTIRPIVSVAAMNGAQLALAAIGGTLPTRAIGGPISPDEMYLVGEKGPELFVSDRAGRIIPNGSLPVPNDGAIASVMRSTGSGIVDGVIGGIDGQSSALAASLSQLIDGSVLAPVVKSLEMASPSKVFYRYGQASVDGYIFGVESRQADAAATMRQFARSMVEAGQIQAEDGSWVNPAFYLGSSGMDSGRNSDAWYAAEFAKNAANDPNAGRAGYVQAEDGSWVPSSFYGGNTIHINNPPNDPDATAFAVARALGQSSQR